MSASERAGGRFRDQALAARVVSGLSLAVLSLAAVWAGGWFFALVLLTALLVALWEFLRLAHRAGFAVLMGPGLVTAAALILLGLFHDAADAGVVLTAAGVWMALAMLRPPLEGRLAGAALTLFGLVYVVGLGIHLLWLRMEPHGLSRLAVVLLATWAADTFAFFVGVRWGRRKLAPHVSPGKSVEGLVGGLVGTVAVTVLAARALLPGLDPLRAAFLGLALGAVSPLGDLLESLIKRNLHAKDASHLIPGHGGVLDRIDSLLVTGAVAYYLFRFL